MKITNKLIGECREWLEIEIFNGIPITDSIVGSGLNSLLVKAEDNKYYIDKAIIEEQAVSLKKFFGAKGDQSSDDSSAINEAFRLCGDLNLPLLIPPGQYKINLPILWNKRVEVRGAAKGGMYGGQRCVLIAGAAMVAMIKGSENILHTDLTGHSFFDGLNLDGNNFAQYGILGVTNHSTFQNFSVKRTTTCAIKIGYGWCNKLENLEISYNSGNGIDLETLGEQANGTCIDKCKVFANNGLGIIAGKGYATSITKNTIESNKKGGIILSGASQGFSINENYFENNAINGFDYTIPSVNIKADIILGGAGTLTAIASAYPNTGTIHGNFTSNAHAESFIFASAIGGCSVVGNRAHNPMNLIRFFGNNTNSTNSLTFYFKLSIKANSGFNKSIDANPVNGGVLRLGDISREWSIDSADNNNIANVDLSSWTNVQVITGGSVTRSAEVFYRNPGMPVYKLSHPGGSSDTFGFAINAANYPHLHGKMMVFGLWIKDDFIADGGVVIVANSTPTHQSYTNSPNVWKFDTGVFVMPATGTSIIFGIRKIGAGKDVYFCSPVLAEVGSNLNILMNNAKMVEREEAPLTAPAPTPPSNTYIQSELISTNERLEDLVVRLKNAGVIQK